MTDALRFDNLSRHHGSVRAVDGVTLEVRPGELFCLLGPSGCGKTTLLELAGGYQTPTAGRVFLAGEDVTPRGPRERNIGMVFQSYALFPHLSVHDNIAFGLRMRGVERAERDRRVAKMLDLVDLTADEAKRKPAKLSGGQQQRVALARALAFGPDVLLLDEPFANLDVNLRGRLREQTRAIQRETGTAAVLVTHDQQEAFEMADRIAVMFEGQVAQVGAPDELYDRPTSRRVAEFVGDANLFEVAERDGDAVITVGGTRFECCDAHAGDWLMLRPEHLVAAPEQDATFVGEVQRVRFRGARQEVEVLTAAGVVTALWSRERVSVGDQVGLRATAPCWVVR